MTNLGEVITGGILKALNQTLLIEGFKTLARVILPESRIVS